jgi:hypothetical protein
MELSHYSPLISSFRKTILALILFSIGNCGIDVEDAEAPEAPLWVKKSAPIDWPERGIDAHEGGQIFLQWNASRDEDVGEYLLYRSLSDSKKDTLKHTALIANIESNSMEIYSYLDNEINELDYYAYWLIALNDAGNRSMNSDTLYYSVMPSIYYDTMIPNSLSLPVIPPIQFSWNPGYWVEMLIQDFTITIIREDGVMIIRERFAPSNYVSHVETWVLPNTFDLEPSLYHWRIDVASDYHGDVEAQGGESEWAAFRVPGE